MSLCRPRKLLNVHFPHFLLSAFSHENPALSSNNLRLFVNNGRLLSTQKDCNATLSQREPSLLCTF